MELTQPIQIAQFRLLKCMATGLELLVRIQFPNIRYGTCVTFSFVSSLRAIWRYQDLLVAFPKA